MGEYTTGESMEPAFREEAYISSHDRRLSWFMDKLSADEADDDALNEALDHCVYLHFHGEYKQEETLLILLMLHLLRKQERQQAGIAMDMLAALFLNSGLDEEAEFEYRQAAERASELSPSHAAAQMELAALLEKQGKHIEAVQIYLETGSELYNMEDFGIAEEAFSRARYILADQGRSETASYGFCLGNLGMVYGRLSMYEEAERFFSEALAVRETLVKTDPGQKQALAILHQNIGILYQNQMQWSEAIDAYGDALTVLSEINGSDLSRAWLYYHIGICLEKEWEFPYALENLKRALSMYERLTPEDYVTLAEVAHAVGKVRSYDGNYNAALQYFVREIGYLEQCPRVNDRARAEAYHACAGAYGMAGYEQEALRSYQEAFRLFRLLGNKNAVDYIHFARSGLLIGKRLTERGDIDDAVRYLLDAEEELLLYKPFDDKWEGNFSDLYSRICYQLSVARTDKDPELAEKHVRKAICVREQCEDHPSEELALCRMSYAKILYVLRRWEEAEQQFGEASSVFSLLAVRYPNQREKYQRRAEEMQKGRSMLQEIISANKVLQILNRIGVDLDGLTDDDPEDIDSYEED